MKSKRDELQYIVERTELSPEWKEMLNAAFQELSARNEKVWHEIRETVLREDANLRRAWSWDWNVVTALVPAVKSTETSGLHRIIGLREEEGSGENLLGEALHIDIKGTYFLDCPYEEVAELCANERDNDYPYEGRINMQGKEIPFRYRLAPYLRFIERERELFDMAEMYGIATPVLFSPYARRAVKIQISSEDSTIADLLQDAGIAPYRFEENYLADKIKSDTVLMWNIQRKELSPPPYHPVEEKGHSFFAPYGDRPIYRYEFGNVNEREFICPAQVEQKHLVSAVKDTENKRIILITEKELSEDCISMRIVGGMDTFEKYHAEDWGRTLFPNMDGERREIVFPKERLRTQGDLERVLYALHPKERLRTQGDLERVLYALQMPAHGLSCSFVKNVCPAPKKDQNIIRRYAKQFAYGVTDVRREQQLYGKNRNLPYAYILFSGDAAFLNDYANFVLSFLERRYPDFQWVGVQ